jgi:hypothetical protein
MMMMKDGLPYDLIVGRGRSKSLFFSIVPAKTGMEEERGERGFPFSE